MICLLYLLIYSCENRNLFPHFCFFNLLQTRLPELAEVEERVRDEWRAARRREVNEAIFAKLLEGYEVVEEPAAQQTAARAGDERGTP